MCLQCWCTSARQWRQAVVDVDPLKPRSTVAGVRLPVLVLCSRSVSHTVEAWGGWTRSRLVLIRLSLRWVYRNFGVVFVCCLEKSHCYFRVWNDTHSKSFFTSTETGKYSNSCHLLWPEQGMCIRQTDLKFRNNLTADFLTGCHCSDWVWCVWAE